MIFILWIISQPYSHSLGQGLGLGLGLGLGMVLGMGSIGSNILYRNVQTGPRQRQGPGPIVSYYPSPSSVQCE